MGFSAVRWQPSARSRLSRPIDMPKKSLQDTINAACAKLEETAAMMGTKVSFDLASVPELEEISAAMKELAGNDQSVLDGGSFLIGAYLGEIIRRQIGGEWTGESGGDRIAVSSGATAIFPIARVREFLEDPTDSLVFFAQAATASR